MSEERRQFQRVNLSKPLDGWFGDFAVRLLDISVTGALVEHDEDIDLGARALLRFYWRNEEVEVTAETIRELDGHAALRFLDRSETLLALLADAARELLVAQEANATGDRERNLIDGDATLTAASEAGRLRMRGFLIWTLADGAWSRRASLLPEQPADGFTLSAAEDPEQVELLCRTYESGDEESRRMTRLLAELSVAAQR
ncbi:MAG: PilZ domain-containing protein [Acidobacteriota bacterium]